MKLGLLLNSNNKLCSFSEKYLEIISRNKIPNIIINPNSYALFENVRSCSHLLFRHSQGDTDKILYESIYNIARNILGVKCSPNYETYWPYEDKVKEYYLLRNHGFPIIESNIFWNREDSESYLSNTKYPIIAKLPKGAGSSNVIKLNSISEGTKVIHQIFGKGVKSRGLKSNSNLFSPSKLGLRKYSRAVLKSNLINWGLLKDKTDYPEWQIQKDVIIFQKFLPGNDFDTRVTVIGDKAISYRRFVRTNDFRASGSGKFDVDHNKINLECIRIALDISKKLGFTTMAYDFIYDENKIPHINEISYCFVDWMVEKCPGYWDENLEWHPGRQWPQHYQLEDFLEMKLK